MNGLLIQRLLGSWALSASYLHSVPMLGCGWERVDVSITYQGRYNTNNILRGGGGGRVKMEFGFWWRVFVCWYDFVAFFFSFRFLCASSVTSTYVVGVFFCWLFFLRVKNK